MSLSQQLQNQANDQRSKQLDLREQALAEREAFLDDTERVKQLEVLDRRFEVKQSLLDDVLAKIADAEKAYQAALKINQLEAAKFATAETRNRHAISKLHSEQERLEVSIANAKQDLQHMRQETIQAQKYLKVQEGQVNETVAEWNAQLTTLHQEAEQLNAEKATIAADIIRLRQQYDTDQASTDELRSKVNTLQQMYQVKADAYRTELATRRQEIDDLQTMRVHWLEERDEALAALHTQEQSLEIREAAVRQKELDLGQREKMLQMKLNMLH